MEQKPRQSGGRSDKGAANAAMAAAIDAFASERRIKSLHALADASKISYATVVRLMNNTTFVDIGHMTKLAKAFGITVTELVARSEEIRRHDQGDPFDRHMQGPP